MQMNNKIIFDASAVVALLAKEKGFEVIKRHLKNAIISSVNISEVYKYCIDKQNLNGNEWVTCEDCKPTYEIFVLLTHSLSLDPACSRIASATCVFSSNNSSNSSMFCSLSIITSASSSDANFRTTSIRLPLSFDPRPYF